LLSILASRDVKNITDSISRNPIIKIDIKIMGMYFLVLFDNNKTSLLKVVVMEFDKGA
jgi:hypothetical protein